MVRGNESITLRHVAIIRGTNEMKAELTEIPYEVNTLHPGSDTAEPSARQHR